MSFHHVSVLLKETVEGLVTDPDGIYVDCTLGGGGHSLAIAKLLSEKGRIIGIDEDKEAIAAAKERLEGVKPHVDYVHDNFRHLSSILDRLGVNDAAGIVFDLGVSSHQIDTPERGFSYMQEGPLDMRMDPESKKTAADVVNTYDEDELEHIFRDYGEERWGKRIAKFIVKERRTHPLETTTDLAQIVNKAIPKDVRRAQSGHPAKRVFQAVRIEVNDELAILADAFHTAVEHLRPGGRIAIITFHSLEDRIAKKTLRQMARGCICPPHIPVCVCGHQQEIRLIGKARKPSAEEIAENSRAKSAKLRLAEKLEHQEKGGER